MARWSSAELRVDLEGPRLHAQCARLARRSRVAVDDQRADAAPDELVREHEPGGTCADDKDVGIHRRERGRQSRDVVLLRYRGRTGFAASLSTTVT